MASPHSYSSLQLLVMRVARLTSTGAPQNGANNGYVTNIPISATLGIEKEEGDEFTVKRGDGVVCSTFKDYDRIKRATLSLELCELDLELIGFLVQGSVLRDLGGAGVGNAVAFRVSDYNDAAPNPVCVELWTKAIDGDSSATPPFLGGTTAAYWHWTLPKCYFQLDDITLENGFATIPVSGWSETNARITANGPFDDWSADVAAAGGFTSALNVELASTVPTASTTRITVTSTAS